MRMIKCHSVFLFWLSTAIIACTSSQPYQCGKTSKNEYNTRMLGGAEVNPSHSQPWVVRLGRCCQCTGTLISDRHILTAAHCELFVSPYAGRLRCKKDRDWRGYHQHQNS